MQDYENLFIICVDDGSEVPVRDCISFSYDTKRLKIIRITHSERYVARQTGINNLKENAVDYMFFLDSDMILPEGIINKLVDYAEKNYCGCIIVPEFSFSDYDNYWSRVKVFERNLYMAGKKFSKYSIDAARFWKLDIFPGFVCNLNSFEEIQPTITYYRNNGTIKIIDNAYILHDEKKVTYRNLLEKKSYYFNHMAGHDAVDLIEVIRRSYFFRPQLIDPKNIKKYICSPLMFFSVMFLYGSLTAIGGIAFLKRKILRAT